MMKIFLELGRISNLPTVWTNCLAAVVLASGAVPWRPRLPGALSLAQFALALFAMSLMYTGGMFLNDAFDRKFDALAARNRPIPSGRIGAGAVFFLGAAQLAIAILSVAAASFLRFGTALSPASLMAVVLSALVVAYDAYHKKNPLSPLLMGLCRVGVYLTVGWLSFPVEGHTFASLGTAWGGRLLGGAMALLTYLMFVTHFAKREGRGTAPPLPIAMLIAGISLLDGLLMALAGLPLAALAGALGFWATLRLQKFVRGT